MPKRTDIKSILIIGSGPIVIGQGCEFDYSGTQACKALKEEGYRVILVNSNPATIMTDPEMADRTYIEPLTIEAIAKIIAKERPDALLPTLGGQTGLNLSVGLSDSGILEKYGVKMIGATRQAIARGEDRKQFKEIIEKIGLKCPKSGLAYDMDQARQVVQMTGMPCIIRASFTLGGTGSGIAWNIEEFEILAQRGLDASMINEIQIDQSLLGWKEYELEVMRDKADNVVIVCSIENFDPMGVHTGDSITVAPAQTLTDKEYQAMRDAAMAIIRAIGVETGGSNIQFAINPADGEMVVIEMNPRVSRSSALASKATGFPIARIAAKLAVGYTLDELPNDITRRTVACFEPSIDYVVVKIPRWTFEKFPDADETLTTQMKSVGEAMSIGRTFKEALQKGIRSMEIKRFGLGLDRNDQWWKHRRAEIDEGARAKNELVLGDRGSFVTRTAALEQAAYQWPIPQDELTRKLTVPSQGRLYYIRYAFKMGYSVQKVHELTRIDPWFLSQIKELADFEIDLLAARPLAADFMAGKIAGEQKRNFAQLLRLAKEYGYSDVQLGTVWSLTPIQVRAMRKRLDIEPVYKLVDTCAAEFEAATPYYYSTYEKPVMRWQAQQLQQQVDDEVRVSEKKKIIILGGGPNRIGQGIEFDYCCVQAAFACRELGLESVMINSNPETVSTDYDTSDLLFFEPLTHEDVLNVIERLNGKPFSQPGGALGGVIVQFGGQTPLNLARSLKDSGAPIIGTAVESIETAEDRDKFNRLIRTLKLRQPEGGIARSDEEARKVAAAIGYPVLMRPSFVLGGRAMEIVSNEEQLNYYIQSAVEVADEHPILIDRFLGDATEVDVDAMGDGTDYLVLGVMEHIEEAGIHSGDSACSLPPFSLSEKIIDEIKKQTLELARALEVRGLMNVQFAIKDDQVYVLEVNPRASRTVPFVSKATGVAWARIAAKVMCGKTLKELGIKGEVIPRRHVSVKESVFPFNKFPGVDIILGPEMRSTGEVMGIDKEFPIAYAKAQMAAGGSLPTSGTVYVSVRDADKPMIVEPARKLAQAGFDLICTSNTYELLTKSGVKCRRINKMQEGRPNIIDAMKNKEVQLLINTPTKKGPNTDEGRIRAAAVLHKIPIITTITGAEAATEAILSLKKGDWTVEPIQDYYAEMKKN
ncbi:MAG TPA: carbamoyl-phosphate synthase large subunit [Phycisphaerae bacterium]|nr:carbamoyl-phosphate synthase large subunit [Phycisphaerae bacterium]